MGEADLIRTFAARWPAVSGGLVGHGAGHEAAGRVPLHAVETWKEPPSTPGQLAAASARRPHDADHDSTAYGVSDPITSLRVCSAMLREAASSAADDVAMFGGVEAAHYATLVEDLSRTMDYLQVIAAGLVQRVRSEAQSSSTAQATGPCSEEYRSAAEYLRASLRISAGEARRRLSLAEAVLPRTSLSGQRMPPVREELAAAMAGGFASSRAATIVTMTLDRARPLCDVPTLERIEASLTATAAENDADFLARVAKRWTEAIDQDGREPSEELLRQRQGAFLRRPRNGLQHLEVFATTDQFEHLITVMNSATNPRLDATDRIANAGRDAPRDGTSGDSERDGTSGDSERDGTSGDSTSGGLERDGHSTSGDADAALDRRSRAQRMLDGLVGACKAALSAGSLPAAGGLRPQVMVTINHEDLLAGPVDVTDQDMTGHDITGQDITGQDITGHRVAVSGTTVADSGKAAAVGQGLWQGNHGGVGSFAFSGPVAAATVRKLACDAEILPVVMGGKGQILDIGRASRVFPPHIRKAITARDLGCAFPGCTMPAPWCEAHHIEYWSRGGATSTDNGTLLCSHHHHLIHKEEWRIHLRDGVSWFVPPAHIDPQRIPRQNRYFRLRQ